MYHPENSRIDENGNYIYEGALERNPGNHDHMPSRTEAYLPGDERGHVNASSTGGANIPENIAPQHHDLNQGAYAEMEAGERNALENGARIDSVKIGYVGGEPGQRPSAFMVSDTVHYPDGHTETIHHSFTNASNAEQEEWNAMSLESDFDDPNPGDGLRESMSAQEYSALMEQTDAELPGIAEEYGATVGADSSGTAEVTEDAGVETDGGMDIDDGMELDGGM